jgi:hypothetical protein
MLICVRASTYLADQLAGDKSCTSLTQAKSKIASDRDRLRAELREERNARERAEDLLG